MGEMIEAIDERGPGVVLWDKNDDSLELFNVDFLAREPAVLG
jgi:hypothetical protein